MAGNIKGITVDIGGNTGPLEQSLKGVNKTSRDLQSELKQVERLLKLDPQNTDLLAQKQKLLGESIDNTKEKLNKLKEAEKQVQQQVKEGKISEEQYRAFQREIAKTESELKKVEEQTKKTNTSFNAFKNSSESFSKGVKGVTIAATGAGAGLVGMAAKAAQSADDLNTLSKVTGLSTDELQKFQYASDRIDVSMEVLSGSMAKLIKNMDKTKNGNKDLQSAFKKLGVSVIDNSGNLRNNNDVFQETISALGKVSNETERDALAMKIFGKSAQELNPLILGGADDLKKYGEEAEKAGLILSQDALDGANKFQDGIDRLKASATQSFGVIGGKIAEDLIPVMDKINDLLVDIVNWIIENKEFVLTTIAAVGASLTALNIGLFIEKIVGFAKGLEGATLGMKLFNLAMSANPIVLVVSLIAGLVAAIITLWNTNEDFRNNLMDMWDGIKNFFGGIGDWIGNKIEWMKEKVKSFFTMEWKFPHIKLPHFSINGSANPLRWIEEGVPKINIDWYAKGGILTKPTIFGMNNGTLLGGGEAGQEAVLPLDSLYSNLRKIIGEEVMQSIVLYITNQTLLDGEIVSEKVTKKVIKNISRSTNNYSRSKGSIGHA